MRLTTTLRLLFVGAGFFSVFVGMISFLSISPLAAQETNPNSQTIMLWHPESGERAQVLEALVARFNAENEWGIEVQAVSLQNAGLLYDRLILQLQNPPQQANLPNLYIAWAHEVMLFALSDRLVDLRVYFDDPLDGFLAEDRADFLPFFDQLARSPWTGALYGLPVRGFTMMMAVNQEALDGLPVEGVPANLATLEQVACDFVENGGWSRGRGDPVAGFWLPNDSLFLSSLIRAQGTPIFEDALSPRYTFATSSAQEAFLSLKRMTEQGCVRTRTSITEDIESFVNGRSLVYFGSTSTLSGLRDGIGAQYAEPFDWAVYPLPGTEDAYVYGSIVSIVAQSPEADLAAWLFLRWFLQADHNAAWSRATTGLPVRLSAAEMMSADFATFPQWRAAWEIYRQSENVLPPVAGHDVVGLELEFAFQNILLGNQPADGALAEFEQLANEILVDFAPGGLPVEEK